MIARSQELIKRIREHGPQMQERFGVRRLRIFGSWARGSARPESDVDVLVEFDTPASARHFLSLQFFSEGLA